MIYHMLPEQEAFSASCGGAVSLIIANIMRFDDVSVAVCAAGDQSWGYSPSRSLVLPGLRAFGKTRGRRIIPPWATNAYFRKVFEPLLSLLKPQDIVWCHSQPSACLALQDQIRSKGAKLIFHSHSSLAFYANRSHFRSLTPDAWIFVSEAMRQEALQLFPWLKNTHAVHNGADETLFFPSQDQSTPKHRCPTILYVGRLNPEKGTHVLMDAMRTLHERDVDAVCKVVGSSFTAGSKATRYEKRLYKDRPPNVRFEGYRSAKEIAQEYRESDVFCSPSVFQEPFGNVNIEAMACGLPVVSTRVGAIPEVASEGGFLLVEPESALQLADALQVLIEDRDLRAKLAAEGLASFKRRFTWPTIVGQYREIEESLT